MSPTPTSGTGRLAGSGSGGSTAATTVTDDPSDGGFAPGAASIMANMTPRMLLEVMRMLQ